MSKPRLTRPTTQTIQVSLPTLKAFNAYMSTVFNNPRVLSVKITSAVKATIPSGTTLTAISGRVSLTSTVVAGVIPTSFPVTLSVVLGNTPVVRGGRTTGNTVSVTRINGQVTLSSSVTG